MNLSQQIPEIRRLLADYSFDIDGGNMNLLIAQWLQQFDPVWVQAAIVEALYQGRYKIVSVHQILHLWQRRGSPLRHYSREFESIIVGPNNLSTMPAATEVQAPSKSIPPSAEVQTPSESIASSSDAITSTGLNPGEPIRPFVPPKEESELYYRLQTVARRACG